MTQADVCNILKISKDYVSRIEKGERFPSHHVKAAIVDWLQPDWPDRHGEGQNFTPGPNITRCVPLISFVQAGDWAEAVEEFSPEEAEEFLPVTSTVGPRTFGLRVVGNSMEPEFREGEIVIVDPDREAETGAYVVAKINHDEATFKQLIKDGGSVFLRPLNSAYPIMDVTGRDLRIVGRVVEKVKRY
jgi:SOS-response transcriptional repressor LexA